MTISRTISSANAAALSRDIIRGVCFAWLDFLDFPVRVHDRRQGQSDYGWGGHTWLSQPAVEIGRITEQVQIQSTNVDIGLEAADEVIALLNETSRFRGRQAVVYAGLLDETYALIDDPWIEFSGFISSARISYRADDAEITIRCVSRAVEWEQTRPFRFTNALQQQRFPGDAIFSLIDQARDEEIDWTGEAAR